MIIIKSAREIDKIRSACQVVSEVLALMQQFVTPGVSTYKLSSIAEDYIRSRHARPAFKGYSVHGYANYPGSICTSINSCIVHGIPSKSVILQEGDIVSIDVGVELDSYYGDAAVTLPVGNVSEENRLLLLVTQEALDRGIQQALKGHFVGDISAAIGDFILAQGFFPANQLSGHGVGRVLHEPPNIPNLGRKGTGHQLKAGMTLAIEPMVNVGTSEVISSDWEFYSANGLNSAHFEHTILITEGSPEILTKGFNG